MDPPPEIENHFAVETFYLSNLLIRRVFGLLGRRQSNPWSGVWKTGSRRWKEERNGADSHRIGAGRRGEIVCRANGFAVIGCRWLMQWNSSPYDPFQVCVPLHRNAFSITDPHSFPLGKYVPFLSENGHIAFPDCAAPRKSLFAGR